MDRNNSIILQAKRIGLIGKHAGSKPIDKIRKAIGRFDSQNYWERKAKEARNK